MDNRDLYKDTVNRVKSNLVSYNFLVENDVIQPINLAKIKSQLVAAKPIIGEIYEEAFGFYREAKEKCEHEYNQKYLQFRSDGKSQGDARAMGKLWTHKDTMAYLKEQTRAEVAKGMRWDMRDVIKDIEERLDNIRSDERH